MMAVEFCDSGLDFLGDIPWETHLCQFYQTREDLIDILVPFLRAGLKRNEFCVWVTSDIVSVDDAIEAMRKEVPDIDGFIRSGQLESFPHTGWYAGDGGFNAQKVLDGWSQKLDHALKKGYAGARITGDTMWLQKKDWQAFMSYESAINDVIEGKKLIVLCTYPLDRCGANEVIDVINTHQSALIRRDGLWDIIESQVHTRLSEVLRKARGELEARVRERTDELVRQAELLDLAHDAIIVRDMGGKIVFWSSGAEGTYGWGKGEAVGKISHDLLRTEFPVPLKEIMAIAQQMGRWEGELTHVGKDGKKIV
ncbi:MAG: MEDS domain-containing protein, partial [Syntrophorhabdaceae bacterium]|nr:MEDS domain-containing protein [Syntrophorhabdaceae bacterium]